MPNACVVSDEDNEGRHVDPHVRSAVPEAVLDDVRDPDRYLPHAGHERVGLVPREYERTQ